MQKPNFWPNNPYPETIFPMKLEDYQIILPDPQQRTALSGMLGRYFWHLASETIWDRLINHAQDIGDLQFLNEG